MPGQVTGTIGQEEVRFENAATESTLAMLVASMEKIAKGLGVKGKDYTKELENLKKKSDLDQKNNKQTDENNKKLATKGKNLEKVNKGLENFGAGLSKLMVGAERLSNGFGKVLTSIFTDTTPTIESFASKVPIVGGLLGALGGILDSNIKTFRDLAGAGVDLGRGLFAAQNAAAKAGLPLEVFAKVVRDNSQTLAKFGGTAGEGAKVFAGVMGGMKKSGFTQNLARLGLSMDEMAENTASYMELQVRRGRAEQMTDAQLLKGAQSYNLELDKMSRATGISRKALDEQNKAMARDARMKLATAKLSEEERLALTAQITQLDQLDPTGQLSAGFKDLIASGGVATTEASRNLVLAMQNSGQDIQSTAAGIYAGTKGSVANADKNFTALGRATENLTEGQRKTGTVLATQGKANLFTMTAAAAGFKSVTDGAAKATKEQSAAIKDSSKAAAAADQALTDVVNSLKSAVLESGILELFSKLLMASLPVIVDLTKGLVKLVKFVRDNSLGDILSEALKKLWENPKILMAITAGIAALFAIAVAKATVAKTVSNIGGGIASKLTGGIGGAATKAIGGSASSSGAGVGKAIASGGEGAGKGIGAALKGLSSGLASLANPAALVGLGAVTLAVMGLAKAFEIASPGFESFGKLLKSTLEGIASVMTSVGGIISGTIKSIADGVGSAIDKITAFQTAGITATTDQIKELSKIPPENMMRAAQGIEAMKVALRDFSPGLMDGISSGLGSMFGGDQADKINKLADAGARLQPVGSYIQSVSTGLKAFESIKFDSIDIGTAKLRALSQQVNATADAFRRVEGTGFDKISEKISSVTASLKEVGSSITSSVASALGLGTDKKKSQEELLTDLGSKMDQLNMYMARLVGIQNGQSNDLKKTAKYTKQASGNLL